MKKKGFTLVELIAVLVIMAIIALISVPIVFNQIESTRLESYKASVRNVISAVSAYMAKAEGVDNFPNEGLIIPNSEYYKRLSLKNAEFTSGRIFLNEEGVLVAQEVSDGTFCASGTKNDLEVIKGPCEFIDETKPFIDVMVNRITTTSITISVNSFDNESGITDYKYYLNGELTAETKDNIYTFKNLKPNTTYIIKVVTVNGNNKEAEQTLNVTTVIREILIEAKPEGWSHSKTVTITFSKETGNEIYRYKKVGDINWINVAGNKVDFLIEQNRTIIAQILAPNGEVVIEVTKAIGSIDNDKPEILGINGNDEVWKLSKQITINATDGVGSGVDSYSFDGGNTWQTENKKVVTEPQTLNVAVKDKLGNISDVKTYEILYIDNTIPKAHSITASTSAGVYENDTWTNKTVTLTANPNPKETGSGYAYQWYEKSGENFIAIEGATNKTLVLENDITKSYRVDIRTNAGSEATTSSNDYIVKIDKIPPSCNMQEQYTTWTKNNRTLKLTCSDSASDCSPNTLEKIWTYNESGKEIKTETLAYTVRDNAGNSKTCTYNNYGIYVDKKSPSISIASTSVKTNRATIGYNATDYGSGPTKATCVYGLDTKYGSTGTVNSNNNGCTLANLKNNTKYYYQICVSDKVGNEKKCVDSSLTTVEIQKPSITSVKIPSKPSNGYVRQEVAKVIYVAQSDITNPRYFIKTTKTGISNISVIKDCGKAVQALPNINLCKEATGTKLEPDVWYEVSGNINVTYNEATSSTATLYATMYDGVSFSEHISADLLKIDLTSPTVTLETASSTNNSITIPYTLRDYESGIGSYTCKFVQASNDGIISAGNANYGSTASSVTNSSCTISGLKDYTEYYYQVCATDNAGNPSTCKTGSAKTKDGTKPSKPTVTLKINDASGKAYSSGAWTNQNVYHTINSTDSGSGISYYQYSHDGKTGWSGDISTLGWQSSYNSNKTQLNYLLWWGMNYNFYVRAVDNAGNVSDVSSVFTVRIDKEAPTCTSSGGSGSWTSTGRTLVGTCSDTGGSNCKGNVSWLIDWSGNWTNLSPGTVYDNAGNSVVCPKNQTVRVDTTTPSVGISAVKAGTNVTVKSGSWSNVGLNFILTAGPTGVSGATIKYCKDTNNKCTPNISVESGKAITAYNTTNGTYYIRYQITTGAGKSSAIGSYTAKVDTELPVINVGTYSATDTQIKIPYTINDTSGVSSVTCNYVVMNPAISADYMTYTSSSSSATTTQCTLSNLISYYDYYYRICATDNAGNTTNCVYGAAKTTDSTVPNLTLQSATTTQTSISVPYTASDPHSGISSTTCEYGTSTSYGKTGTVSGGKCTMSGLSANTTYYYKITTKNGAGKTNFKTDSAKTTAAAVTSCEWYARAYRASSTDSTITIEFTPSTGCTFKNIEDLDSTKTLSKINYPRFMCGVSVINGVPTPLACGTGTGSWIKKENSLYVYRFSELLEQSWAQVWIRFKASFNEVSSTSSVSYKFDGCNGYDPDMCDYNYCTSDDAYYKVLSCTSNSDLANY